MKKEKKFLLKASQEAGKATEGLLGVAGYLALATVRAWKSREEGERFSPEISKSLWGLLIEVESALEKVTTLKTLLSRVCYTENTFLAPDEIYFVILPALGELFWEKREEFSEIWRAMGKAQEGEEVEVLIKRLLVLREEMEKEAEVRKQVPLE